MSDERATQSINMRAARNVDVTKWLFVSPASRHHDKFLESLHKNFGAVDLVWYFKPDVCGAVFISMSDGSIPSSDVALLEQFFLRDASEARVFEFDKFSGHFISRRWDEILLRKSPVG